VSGQTLTGALAEFAIAARDGVPEEVARSARQRVLDTFGVAVASLAVDTSGVALGFVADQGGRPEAHAIGVGPTAAGWAAFGNGVLAHSLDFDDTHLPSVLHPSANVVPAAFAQAERVGADGALAVRAAAVGIEVCVRLGMAGYSDRTRTSACFEHGQHATSICGALGAAVAAAMLTPGADAALVGNAVGVAASMAAGIIECNRTGGTVKRVHAGWAAHAGLVAADLARRGLTGPPTALEGRFGFFEAWLHGDEIDPQAVTRGLGEHWEVPGIFFKPYPANHFTHTAVDAARRLRESGVRAEDIEHLTLGVAGPIVRTIGEPLEVKQRPQTSYQAQFSGPFAIAVGLLGGSGLGATAADYTPELARSARYRELMSRVEVVADPRCDEIFPYQFPSRLTARLAGGRVVTEEVLVNRGGPGNPLSDEELARKFADNAGRFLPASEIDWLSEAILDLDAQPGAGEIMARLSAARAR
jgi:2-methylcitrate dehydratase PrpD